jgi:hypothetical protein
MSQTAAHLVDHLIPRVPLSPLLAAQPKPMTPVLQVVHRGMMGFCSLRPV